MRPALVALVVEAGIAACAIVSVGWLRGEDAAESPGTTSAPSPYVACTPDDAYVATLDAADLAAAREFRAASAERKQTTALEKLRGSGLDLRSLPRNVSLVNGPGTRGDLRAVTEQAADVVRGRVVDVAFAGGGAELTVEVSRSYKGATVGGDSIVVRFPIKVMYDPLAPIPGCGLMLVERAWSAALPGDEVVLFLRGQDPGDGVWEILPGNGYAQVVDDAVVTGWREIGGLSAREFDSRVAEAAAHE